MKENFEMIAKTFYGLEEILAAELRTIGAKNIIQHNRALSFIGSNETMYKANYLSRTALRILKPIIKCKVQTPKALYKNVKKYEWERLFSLQETFAIDTVVSSEYFKHSKFVALKVKDAIVDRFRDELGERPNVDVDNPTVRISVHIFNDTCTISLDSSGDSLHKRGYRTASTAAPLNEALAAGMILLSGWDKGSEFIDGMCGSGTIPIEAGLIALNIPPGYLKESYGFMKWKDFDSELWQKIKDEVEVKAKLDFKIIASDKSEEAIAATARNINSAKLSKHITIEKKYFDEQKSNAGFGTLIMNPPYGERLKEDDLNQFYTEIGDTLKVNFTGFDACILSASMSSMKKVGLKTSRRLTLFNGALECKYHKYELYRGTKKKFHEED
ncbi:MAG: THUMP domain-containing protein [Melioribacteraceae bacterium]|jgi:putative N6-adenine-specific DNA methylase|nr:THUMP domain-containing protein [Melioribacteraceae bacterium]